MFLSSLLCSLDVGLLVDTVLFSVVELICSLIAWTDRERSKLHLAGPFQKGLFPHHLAGEPHYTSEMSVWCELRLGPCQYSHDDIVWEMIHLLILLGKKCYLHISTFWSLQLEFYRVARKWHVQCIRLHGRDLFWKHNSCVKWDISYFQVCQVLQIDWGINWDHGFLTEILQIYKKYSMVTVFFGLNACLCCTSPDFMEE